MENEESKVKLFLNKFKTATSPLIKEAESSKAVKFIKTGITKLESVIKTLDTLLKKHGVDIGDMYEQSKEKSKSLLEKAKGFISDTKEKGLLGKSKETLDNVKSKLSTVFKDENKTDTSPPPEEKKPKKSIFGWMNKQQEREDKHEKEVEDEKKAVKENAAKKPDSWLGKILGGLTSLGGMILTGLGKGLGFLGGFVVKGLSKAFMGGIKMLPRLFGGVITSVLKGAGGLAWEGVKAGGKALLTRSPALLTGVRTAAMALATSPIGLGIAATATVLYGGYKLYKYLTRNDIAEGFAGKLTRLRLMMYGFSKAKEQHYHRIFDLEMLMKDYISYKDNEVRVSQLDEDAREKILDIFGISKEEKDKYEILNRWFMGRFMPAYKAFMTALYSFNNAFYLDELESISKPKDQFDLVSKLRVPVGIYDILKAPTFDDTGIYCTKDEVDTLLTNIINDAKKVVDPTGKLAQAEAKKTEQENNKYKQNTSYLQSQLNRRKIPEPETKTTTQPTPALNTTPPSDASEEQPKTTGTMNKAVTKVSGKINMAGGNLIPGDNSLTGIKSHVDKAMIYSLDPNVKELFTGMAKEYNSLTGKDIRVTEAFRTYERQKALYAKDPSKAAKPGSSPHEFGLAIDIVPEDANELEKMGLMAKYGFTRPIGQEDWHLEPAYVSTKPELAKTDINQRTNLIQASIGNGGGGYGLLSNSIKKRRDIDYQVSLIDKSPYTLVKTDTKDSPNIPTPQPISTVNKQTSGASDVNKIASSGGNMPGMFMKTQSSYIPDNKKSAPITTTQQMSPMQQMSPNPNLDMTKYGNLGPEDAIRQASKIVGIDENILLAYAKMESGLRGGVGNKSSSAAGLFQIVGPTWDGLMNKYGSKYNIPKDASHTNNLYNAILGAAYAKENMTALGDSYKSAGVDEATAIYLGHHYGASGAKTILNQLATSPNIPMRNAVSNTAYSSNMKEIGNHTVSSYVQMVSGKITTALNTPSKTYTGKETTSIAQADPNIQPAIYKKTTTTPTQSPGISNNINNTPYMMTSSKPQEQPQPQQPSYALNTKNMESIMNSQLSTLTQIATILTSIDGKIDLSKLKDSLTQNNMPKEPQKIMPKTIPNNSVNLSRKAVI